MPAVGCLVVIAVVMYVAVAFYLFLPLGCIYGAGIAIKNYFTAFDKNIRRQGISITASQPAQKNYFFDRRAYENLKRIIAESWHKNSIDAEDCYNRCKEKKYRWFAPLFFAAAVAIYIFGSVFFLLCSAIHIILMFAVVCIVFTLYSLAGMMDFVYRKCKGIFTVCPSCYAKGKLPVYHCPSCNGKHSKLYPGSYGIFMRECNCGEKIPAMFFNGRNHLEASCPACGYAIKAKESRPTPIPIVGAPYAGKTYFLYSMVWHIKEKFAPSKGLGFEFIDKISETQFNSCMRDLDTGKSLPKTVENNPVALNFFLSKGANRSLLYFYDSAGEAFASTQHLALHKFYDYFNGLVFIIDPFSIPDIQFEYESQMAKAGIKPSLASVEDVYESLIINLEKNYNIKVTERISKPTAIVFSKTGLLDLQQKFGNASARHEMNEKCKQFLRDNGEESLLRKIDRKFKNSQYFAVDSNGRNSTGMDDVTGWLLGKIREKRKFSNIASIFATFVSILSGLAAIAAIAAIIWAAVELATRESPSPHWYIEDSNAMNFTISTAEELEELSRIVNGSWKKNRKRDHFAGKTIRLARNIDLAQYENWVPIGDSVNPFLGTFNGSGYTISNLTVNRPDADHQGLFGYIEGGRVQTLGLDGVNIKGRNRVGAVAGTVSGMRSNITSSYSSGNINGIASVGGLAGTIIDNSNIAKSYSSAIVNGSAFVGGLAGNVYDASSVGNSSFLGRVNGNDEVGGIAGGIKSRSYITNSYSIGAEVNGNNKVGGIAGSVYAYSYIINSYSLSAVKGNEGIGGVAGGIYESNVANSYSAGVVSGNDVVGGIAGNLRAGMVTNCAALNPQVKGIKNSGRVVSEALGKFTLSNNVALSKMTNSAGNAKWSKKGAATENGADITDAAIKRDGTIGGRFSAANGWIALKDGLPTINR
jgi:hypothetical protein